MFALSHLICYQSIPVFQAISYTSFSRAYNRGIKNIYGQYNAYGSPVWKINEDICFHNASLDEITIWKSNYYTIHKFPHWSHSLPHPESPVALMKGLPKFNIVKTCSLKDYPHLRPYAVLFEEMQSFRSNK